MKLGARDIPDVYLERFPEAGGPAERILITRLPFTFGRSEFADHTVYSSKVSKEHATLDWTEDGFLIKDNESTNGTFVNGERTTGRLLDDGDIVHLAHVEFCFRYGHPWEQDNTASTVRMLEQTELMSADRRHSVIRGTELLRDLIDTNAVDMLYQPIVDLRTRSVVAFEALARGTHPELPVHPVTLLELAEQCNLVVELSRMFAKRAVTLSARLPRHAKIFVNIHPQELTQPDLFEALQELAAAAAADRQIVLEIAEASITDVSAMGKNKAAFSSLGLQFAYDDFGAGQARLIELTDIPPDYLKFDKAMIEGIEAAAPRQEMVSALLRVVRTLGVRVIAEGVETELVAAICQRLGCDLGQGFLFGRPA